MMTTMTNTQPTQTPATQSATESKLAFYFGLASIIPLVAILCIPAIVLGIIALRKGQDKTRSIIGIVIAVLVITAWFGLLIAFGLFRDSPSHS